MNYKLNHLYSFVSIVSMVGSVPVRCAAYAVCEELRKKEFIF